MSTATVPPRRGTRTPRSTGSVWPGLVWAGFVIVAMLLLGTIELTTWAAAVVVAATALVVITARAAPAVDWVRLAADRRDLVVVGGLYLAVVGLLRLAFVVFGTAHLVGLFLSYAAALLLGVAGPIGYTVWVRRRPLRTLGIGVHNLRSTLVLGVVLAGVQFAMTLWGVQLPAPVEWVPLLVMALMVGLFEAVFFRGFIQARLQASFGTVVSVAGASGLYALYHVGYGMGTGEIVFLFGLGIVYAIAYRLVDNILVLWPLLVPLGSFFNNLQSGDIDLPWASIAGFAEVLAVMAAVIWLAVRRQRRADTHPLRAHRGD
jgi:uncharacterized protein